MAETRGSVASLCLTRNHTHLQLITYNMDFVDATPIAPKTSSSKPKVAEKKELKQDTQHIVALHRPPSLSTTDKGLELRKGTSHLVGRLRELLGARTGVHNE